MNLFSWMTLLISFVCMCSAKKEVPRFSEIPADLHIAVGKPITLLWQHNIDEDEEKDCYWEFDDLHPVQKPKVLLSYAVGDGVRPGEDIPGWFVTNNQNPCFGGIKKAESGMNDAGYYSMAVGTLVSQSTTVRIYDLSQLLMKISFGETVHNISAEQSNNILKTITGTADTLYRVEINLNDNFPPVTYVAIKKFQGPIKNFDLHCNNTRKCQAEFSLGMENDITAVIEIDTGLTDYPVLRLEQPFEYTGVPDHNNSATVATGVLLGLAILGLISVILWMKFHRDEKHTNTLNIAIGLAKAQCYSYYYNIIPLAAEDFNRRNGPEEHFETCDKVFILITTSGNHVVPEKLDNIALEGETRFGEPPKVEEITPGGPPKEGEKARRGPPKRKISVYKINDNEQVWRVMIDQPRNLATIRKVYAEKRFLKQEKRSKEIKHYSICLDEILRKRKSCYDRYKVIVFEDTIPGPGLSRLILSKIKEGRTRNSHSLQIPGKGLTEVRGLAVSYCYGFIQEVLQDLQRFVDTIKRCGIEGVATFNKFIILVQESGEFSNFNNQDHIEKQEESKFQLPVKISESNMGHVDVFRITDPEDDAKAWYVMLEQPRIISVLNTMLEERDGLYCTDDKKGAILQFITQVQDILNRLHRCKDKYVMLTYRGSSDKNELATEICNTINHSNADKNANNTQENCSGEERKHLMDPQPSTSADGHMDDSRV